MLFKAFGEVVPEVECLQLRVQGSLLREELLAPPLTLASRERPREDERVVRRRVLIAHHLAQRLAAVVPVDLLMVLALPGARWPKLKVREDVDASVLSWARVVCVRIVATRESQRQLLERRVGDRVEQGLA